MIEVKNLVRSFTNGDTTTTVLKSISLKIADGEFVAIRGRSGAGKSTLLYQMSLLDHPTSGQVLIGGQDTTALSTNERIKIRLTKLGYIFQDYAILPELTAVENVALPLLMQGYRWRLAAAKASTALERMGLGNRLRNLPSQLSGGEQQRVSIARAISHNPSILFADEPTASLDSVTAEAIMTLLTELNAAGQTIVMVTHEDLADIPAQRVITLDDGRVVEDIAHHSTRRVSQRG